jgi:hypothetical protein
MRARDVPVSAGASEARNRDVVRAGARRESGARQRGGGAQRDDLNGERPLLGSLTRFEQSLGLLAL